MEETDQTVCCPVPVSNSQNDPMPPSGAARRCHGPTVHVEVGGRCGKRETRAVDTQTGSTDNFQASGSKLLLRLNLHRCLWPPVAAAVAIEKVYRASSLFSSLVRCRSALDCCCPTDDLKMSRNLC